MQITIPTLLSLLSVLSAVPASLALPEPGSLRHNARELMKRAPVQAIVIVDVVIGRTCPSESCGEGPRRTLGNPINCDCYADSVENGPIGTMTNRWALEFKTTATTDDNSHDDTTGTTNSSAPGITAAKEETWYPYSGLDLTQNSLPACP